MSAASTRSAGGAADKGQKSSRFATRKQKRVGKRTRSDGFVLGVELGINSDEDEKADDVNRIRGLDPDSLNFIFWLRNPTVQSLSQLRKSIKCNDPDWMRCFLEFDGLGLLFQCLTNLCSYQSMHLTDMVLRMSCATCIREVVNSQSGLDSLLNIKDRKDNLFGRRIATAMETNNLMVKMQIFELLSALCVFSSDGYYLTLDALEKYKVWRKQGYRFSLLVLELNQSDLSPYRTSVMALINSILFANDNLGDRVRIRNEFIALNIIDVIQSLRQEKDADLHVQFDVFEEELSADSEAMSESCKVIDINNPQELFKTVFNKVDGTPLSPTLVSILYSLYQIESSSPHSEGTWILVERLTQQAVEGAVKADRILEEAKKNAKMVDAAMQTQESIVNTNRSSLQRRAGILGNKRLGSDLSSKFPALNSSGSSSQVPSPPPPPPPPAITISSAPPPTPPPPPPCPPSGAPPPPPPPPLPPGSAPPPPPPPPGAPCSPGAPPPPPSPLGFPAAVHKPVMKPIETPNPNCKMKHFTWNKVANLAADSKSIWGEVNKMDDSVEIEYGKLEDLFSQKVVKEIAKPEEKVPKANTSTSEITLLDPKRSMNVNIFLKQFRKNNAAIIELIRKGEGRSIGVEKLRGLIKILPQMDEIDLIKNYDGDAEKLGNAEKFFSKLIALPCYRLRLELMVLQSDFQSQLSSLRTNLLLLNGVCRRLYDNQALKKFLRLVLHAGNFINKGSNAGGAAGFRMSSLNKLVLTKSNDPKLSLLHVLVGEAEKKDKEALAFVDDLLDDLHKASRFTLESITSEFNQIKGAVKKSLREMEAKKDEEIKGQFGEFLDDADGDLTDLDEILDRLKKQTERLAQHYCENEHSFNLEEFLSNFREFCDRVKACQQEIQSRRQQEEKIEMRKKAQEELLERRKNANATRDPPSVLGARRIPVPGHMGPGDSKIVDNLVNEIRRGNVLRRLSVKRKSRPISEIVESINSNPVKL